MSYKDGTENYIMRNILRNSILVEMSAVGLTLLKIDLWVHVSFSHALEVISSSLSLRDTDVAFSDTCQGKLFACPSYIHDTLWNGTENSQLTLICTAAWNGPNVPDLDVRSVRSICGSVTGRRKPNCWQKLLHQWDFSTRNPTWIIVGLNRSLQCKKLAINRALNIQLTNSIEQYLVWEVNCSSTQEITPSLWIQNVFRRVSNDLPLISMQDESSPHPPHTFVSSSSSARLRLVSMFHIQKSNTSEDYK